MKTHTMTKKKSRSRTVGNSESPYRTKPSGGKSAVGQAAASAVFQFRTISAMQDDGNSVQREAIDAAVLTAESAEAKRAKQRQKERYKKQYASPSWCYGHLAELANASVYDEKYKKWRAEDLPIFPDEWKYTAAPDKEKHLALLKKLLNRKDVAEVVNACDAGREGELIFRTVYNLSGCTKIMKRLWISSMEDEAIREGIRNLRLGTEYDRLYAAALCRAKADWLVGINMTRFFSIQYDNLLNVGRVVSPTLSLIVTREAEIGAFTSEPFYTVVLDCGFSLASERFKDKGDAEKLAEGCRDTSVTVTKAESKEKSERAPQLYDLTSLQRDANRQLGYTAQQTLNYLQSLYEKKLCTYPRTDSRFLTDDMVETVPKLLSAAATVLNLSVPKEINAKQICNSKKVSDHHAVVPTEKAGTVDLMVLSPGEREILRLVAQQLLMAVGSPCKYKETEITAECAGKDFHVKGKILIEPGWRSIIPAPGGKEELPDLEAGTELPISNVEVKTGKTTPPQRYTEDTLLSAMEAAGEKEMPEDAERQGIGTPATRAGIIEKLISAGFAVRQKGKKAVYLVPSDIGRALITVLPSELQSPLLTAEWETNLKRVEKGELADKAFIEGIEEMVADIMRNYKKMPGAEMLFPKRDRRKKFENMFSNFTFWGFQPQIRRKESFRCAKAMSISRAICAVMRSIMTGRTIICTAHTKTVRRMHRSSVYKTKSTTGLQHGRT